MLCVNSFHFTGLRGTVEETDQSYWFNASALLMNFLSSASVTW